MGVTRTETRRLYYKSGYVTGDRYENSGMMDLTWSLKRVGLASEQPSREHVHAMMDREIVIHLKQVLEAALEDWPPTPIGEM